MNEELRQAIEQEIKNLVPVEKFKKVYHKLYDGLIRSCWSEDIVKSLPENHAFALVENKVVVQKKDDDKEGFEKFIAENSSLNFQKQEPPSFADILEKSINESHWQKLLVK